MDKRKNKSAEWRQKISESVKRLWRENPDYARRVSEGNKAPKPWLKGDNNPAKRPEVKAKISKSTKKAMQKPEVRRRYLKGLKKRILPKERNFSEETRQMYSRLMSERMRRLTSTSEGRMRILRNILDNITVKPNKSERRLDAILQEHFPGEWKFVGDGSVVIYGLYPDFINVNGEKKIIELFGEYWHREVVDDWKRTPEGRKAMFSKVGYDTLIVWDYELNDEETVVERVADFMGGRI